MLLAISAFLISRLVRTVIEARYPGLAGTRTSTAASHPRDTGFAARGLRDPSLGILEEVEQVLFLHVREYKTLWGTLFYAGFDEPLCKQVLVVKLRPLKARGPKPQNPKPPRSPRKLCFDYLQSGACSVQIPVRSSCLCSRFRLCCY